MKWMILAALVATAPHKPAPPMPAGPVTYYVRVDGGTPAQCDGRHDAAFSKTVKQRACAWRHPFDAFPPGGTSRIAGGDTLIVAAGSYEMGLGAPDAVSDKCRSDWPWDCHMSPVPSGPSADKPTRVLGVGWDKGCAAPPELWGTERAETVLDLRGSSNVQLACFEITDHSSCIEFHAGNGHEVDRCQRDKQPYGPWAAMGLVAADSSNVSLADLNIHGLAHDGVRAGRLRDWTVERVKIVANGWSGWNGDIDDKSSNSGRMIFRDVQIAWNGCGEKYPSKQPFGCWGQQEGGYGDGLGTGETGGDWLFERTQVDHNTQDGLDLLHARGDAKITFRQVHAEANAGNQLKAGGSVDVEKSVLIGTCTALAQSGLDQADLCRAEGNSLSLHPSESATVKVIDNQISGQGDCLIDMECGGGGCRSVKGLIKDNTLTGLPRTDVASAKSACSVWIEPALRGADLRFVGNRLKDVRSTGCPAGMKECSEKP